MLPGQLYCSSRFTVSGARVRDSLYSVLNLWRKVWIRRGISSGRSRSGGIRSSATFSRYLTFNEPDKRNPLGYDVSSEIIRACDILDDNDDVRCLVLRGAGGNFSAGGDMYVMKDAVDRGLVTSRPIVRIAGESAWRLLNTKKPTIAWVEGAIAGAGLALAAACDFSIINEMSKCVFAFVNIGFVPDTGAAAIVARAVGTTRAKELLMSGRIFRGKEAAEMGLFTEAVPKEDLEARVQAYIEKYAKGPTIAYGNIKTMLNQVQFSGFNLLTPMEIEMQAQCEMTYDHKESVYAFLEKRPAQFLGR